MATKKSKVQTYELTYTGALTGAPTIYVHYGTENWSEITEVKMRKLKTCYKTEITVPTGASINYCFRDAHGNWDNNAGNDYYYAPTAEYTTTYTTTEITPCK